MRLFLFAVAVIATALGIPRAASADILTGLVGYWPFSGNAADASGFGNHGAPNAAATLTADRDGNANAAFLFDGLSSRIDIPSSASLVSPTSEITMAAWIRRDGWGMVGQLYNPILTKSIDAPNDFQYRFIITPSGLGTAFNSWNESRAAASTYDEGVWYHVASTWKADTLRSYVNGQIIDATPFAVTIDVDPRTLSIGSDVPGILEIFYGAIDEVRIYARALSDGAIWELYGPPVSALEPVAGHSFRLGRAYPNPALTFAVIPFSLEFPTRDVVEVFDARGRRVRTLGDRDVWTVGAHSVTWDGRDATGSPAASGVYFYRLGTPTASQTKKAVLRR
jgi:hypothetical protein